MNILFYIEPLFFHNNPFHYWAWLDHAARLNWHLFCHKPRLDSDYRFVMSEALLTRSHKYKHVAQDKMITMSQSEIRDIFHSANMDIAKMIHHQTYTQRQKEDMGRLIKEKCKDFVPDLIITFSPAYFFQEAFPDCLIMHTENGPFTRAPYPYTTYYDPLGFYDYSMLGRFHQQIKEQQATAQDRKYLEGIKSQFQKHLEVKSPFHYLENMLRKKFRKLLLVPLQTSHTMYFDMNGPFNTHTEMLYDVIEKTPKDVAIIVTYHNICYYLQDTFPKEHMEYIAAQHQNVIICSQINNVNAASQYLLNHVDACLSISSSIGIQALFWGVPLVHLGASHLQYYSSGLPLSSMWDDHNPSDDPHVHDGALAWMFRNYYLHDTYGVRQPGWMIDFFKKSIQRKREGVLDLRFFDPIDSDEKLLHCYAQDPMGLRQVVPQFLNNFKQISRSMHKGSIYYEGQDYKQDLQINSLMNGNFSIEQAFTSSTTEILAAWHCITHEPQKITVSREEVNDSVSEVFTKDVDWSLKIQVMENTRQAIILTQKILQLSRFINKDVALTFWARSQSGSFFNVSFQYELLDHPQYNKKTENCRLAPVEEWVRYSHVFTLPEIDRDTPIHPSAFLQFAIELPPLASGQYLEIAGLVLTIGDTVMQIQKDNIMVDDELCLEWV